MALFRKIVIASLLFTSTSTRVFGQNSETANNKLNLYLEGAALLAVATGDIELQIKGVTEAGAALTNTSENSDTRLRITSLAEIGIVRLVSVKMSRALSGTELTVQALPPSTTHFTGDGGSYAGVVTLSTQDQVLINNIGTCWSGTDQNDGYTIKYTYKIKTIAQGEIVNIDQQTLETVTFTISDTN
jgi:hypothetical protein